MTISVIVKTFERPMFLRRALADIAAQTLAPDEVLIVNDGGDPQPVHQVADASPLPVQVIDLPQTKGRAGAANEGITRATGDYLVLHDDDDTWDPAFLATTSAWLDHHPDDEGVVVRTNFLYERLDEDGTLTELSQVPFEPGLQQVTFFDLLRINRFVPIAFLYRRAAHDTYGLLDENLAVVEDWAFHLRLAQHRPIPVIPGPPLAFWHQRPESTGAVGNSVIVDHEAHRNFDLLKRDAELRAQPEGIGGLLYLTRFMDDRFHDLHDRFDQEQRELENLRSHVADLQHALTDESWLSFVRRKLRRR